MKNEKHNIKISKFLSLVLRHKPETIGIVLDENGWTDVYELISKSNKADIQFDLELLRLIVASNSKKRFEFNETMDQIRASQGHSIKIDLGYQAKSPPEFLYHGTAVKNVDSILINGILKKNRHHVHLSVDKVTALDVGNRHGKPIVFEVASMKMHQDDYEFFLSKNGVWLVESVPPQYLKILEKKK